LEAYITAILVLIGTLGGSLGGQFIAGKWQLKKQKLDWRKQYGTKLADQIQQTLDDLIKILTDYDFDRIASGTVSSDSLPNIKKVFSTRASMKIRILSFEDNEMNEAEKSFSESFIRYSQGMSEEDQRQREITNAINSAALIVKRLGKHISDV